MLSATAEWQRPNIPPQRTLDYRAQGDEGLLSRVVHSMLSSDGAGQGDETESAPADERAWAHLSRMLRSPAVQDDRLDGS
jgi:hypothetical protein